MLTIESKTGIARGSQETVFAYISDFRNFSGLLPREHMNDLEISPERITFSIQGLGMVGLLIRDKKPSSELTISATEDSSADFTFTIHIREAGQDRSEVQLNLVAKLNMFIELMARNPLQQFVDLVVDKLGMVDFGKPAS